MCVFTADCMFTLGKAENGYRLSQCESVRGTAKLVHVLWYSQIFVVTKS